MQVHTDVAALDAFLPARVKKQIAALKPELYVIDARAVADSVGLGKYINMVMQTVFFRLSNVLPFENAIELLKKSIVKAYTRKGPKIVEKNQQVCVEGSDVWAHRTTLLRACTSAGRACVGDDV